MERKRILIADDNEDILDSLTLLMEKEGYQIETTTDGNWLLRTDLELPDLILLDTKLSNSDGRKICMKLKRQKETKDIPVLMFSAAHEIGESTIKAGADDFISKPFTK